LFISKDDLHHVRSDKSFELEVGIKFKSRIRYRQALQDVLLYFNSDGAFLVFNKKQLAITRGQFAVWYKNDELIGSGVID
jgi:tRNA-specific 2-thiouridylase